MTGGKCVRHNDYQLMINLYNFKGIIFPLTFRWFHRRLYFKLTQQVNSGSQYLRDVSLWSIFKSPFRQLILTTNLCVIYLVKDNCPYWNSSLPDPKQKNTSQSSMFKCEENWTGKHRFLEINKNANH